MMLPLKRTAFIRLPQAGARVAVVAFAAMARAQDPVTATLRGLVTDPTGAVVSGARVRAVRRATGVVREVVSDAHGGYVITNLAPGDYAVTVEADGLT